MSENTSHLHPEPGRFHFWLDTHLGQRPPDHLIPAYLKSTYAEWDKPFPVKKVEATAQQPVLFEAVR